MKPIRKWFIGLLLLLVSTTVLAQDNACPAIVQTALAAVDQACSTTGRNQACYGNVLMDVTMQPGFEDLKFNDTGDIVDVSAVDTLQLTSLDEQQGTWGVALMRLQANIPDSLPGQNVTFLLFGDVEIQNAAVAAEAPAQPEAAASLPATISSMAVLMDLNPSAQNPMLGTLNAGDSVSATGRALENTFIQVTLADGKVGWVSAEQVTVDGDVSSLPLLDPMGIGSLTGSEPAASSEPEYGPMQAFYFRTGIGEAPCEEVPGSGMLIQTPEGAGTINLRINEVDVQLGSTAYFQAGSESLGDQLVISVLEGNARVSALGGRQSVPAGALVRVELNQDGIAAAPPTPPEPYDASSLGNLPIGVLEREIEIAPALTQEQLDALTAPVALPISGDWLVTSGQVTIGGDCAQYLSGDLFPQTTQVITLDQYFRFDPGGGATMEIPEMGSIVFTNPEPDLYVGEFQYEGGLIVYEFHVLAPDHVELQMHMSFSAEGMSCTMDMPFDMVPA